MSQPIVEPPSRTETAAPLATDDVAQLAELAQAYRRMRHEVARVIVGQDRVVEEVLIALLAGGHALLVGVPGLAKTLLVRTLAGCLDLKFSRVQFTPDLMPTDITGTEVLQEDRSTGTRSFRFVPGPIFANVVLADEINRTPPKTQAALLEAMAEHQVTAGGERHRLPEPFFVLATQNPIEQEGTYPLPEAQLDRFMFNILVGYPGEDEELEIAIRTTGTARPGVEAILSGERLTAIQNLVRRIPVAPHIARYGVRLARATRPETDNPDEEIRRFVDYGAGPRASQYLLLGAKARAALHGEPLVRIEDIRAVAGPVLRHRIRINFHGDAEGRTPENVITHVLERIKPTGDS